MSSEEEAAEASVLIEKKGYLSKKITSLEIEIEKIKNTAKNANLKSLEDGGAKLKELYKQKKGQLQKLELDYQAVKAQMRKFQSRRECTEKVKVSEESSTMSSASSVDSDKENEEMQSAHSSSEVIEEADDSDSDLQIPVRKHKPVYRLEDSDEITEDEDPEGAPSETMKSYRLPDKEDLISEDEDPGLPPSKSRESYRQPNEEDLISEDSDVEVLPVQKVAESHISVSSDSDADEADPFLQSGVDGALKHLSPKHFLSSTVVHHNGSINDTKVFDGLPKITSPIVTKVSPESLSSAIKKTSPNYPKPNISTVKMLPPELDFKSTKLSNYTIPKLPSAKVSPPTLNQTTSQKPVNKVSPASVSKATSDFAMPNISALKISPHTYKSTPSLSSQQFSSNLKKEFQVLTSSTASSSSSGSTLGSSYHSQPTSKEKAVWNVKLPSSNFNLNELGKKAAETYRVQQSELADCLRTTHQSMSTMPDESVLMSDPKALKSLVELMPHQKHALAWLLWREQQKPRGGILADDMGLGKTLTMISLILMDRQLKEEAEQNGSSSSSDESDVEGWATSGSRPKKYPGGTLVIAPATLLSQWEGEVNKRVKSGALRVLVHHGSKREDRAKRLARYDMVVTTFGIVASDGNNVETSPLYGVAWDRIIIDEAHTIRNPKTKNSIAICNLTARKRWALTGTPIHNKQLDMYGLLKFLKYKPFDNLNVWKTWVDNKATVGTQRLNTVIKCVLLRRTKEQLLTEGANKLPPKDFKKVEVKLDPDEKEVYHKLLLLSNKFFESYLHQRAEKAELDKYGVVMSRKKHVDQEKNEELLKDHPELEKLYKRMMAQPQDLKVSQVLVLILRLRQMCCHPSLISALIDKETISADGIEEDGIDIDFMDQFKRMSLKPSNAENNAESDEEDSPSKYLSSSHPLFSRDRISSKIRKIIEILEADILPSEDKVVIVSQWTNFLSIIGDCLRSKQIQFDELTGAIAIPDRGPIVEKFNTPDRGPKVLLLSLTAGGCGLNLVGGNRLMLIDIHWNPQLENQACDRIYRVGQKKDVVIYRFVTADTIEEGIEKIQQKKLNVADQVLTGAKKINAAKLTLDDMKLLFNMDSLETH